MSMKKVVADQLGVERVGMKGRSHAMYSRSSVMVSAKWQWSSHDQNVRSSRMSHAGWMCCCGVMRSG